MTDWMWREGTTLISWGSPFMTGGVCVGGVKSLVVNRLRSKDSHWP